MSQVRVSPELLAALLFPGLDVEIVGVGFTGDLGDLALEIEGDDVPATAAARVTFEPVGEAAPPQPVPVAHLTGSDDIPITKTHPTRWGCYAGLKVTHDEARDCVQHFLVDRRA